MIIPQILDILKFKSAEVARLWAEKVKKTPNMKRCSELSEEQLVALNQDIYPVVAAWCQAEKDKNSIGGYFVRMGKDRLAQGFSVSETIMTLILVQRIVEEYVIEETITENAMELYALIELQSKISDFFMLGSFYATKGFLEDAFVGLIKGQKADQETIKQYLRDDFFFKDSR